MNDPFSEGQFYPAPPPPPSQIHQGWMLPTAVGALAIPALMIGWGISQQQQPQTASSPPPSPTAISSPFPPLLSNDLPKPISTPSPSAQTLQLAKQPNARIGNCESNTDANFRHYPSLDQTAIAAAIPCGTGVLLTGEQVRADGVIWLSAQYQGEQGWIARELVIPLLPVSPPLKLPQGDVRGGLQNV